jgi:hypothetical protein
MKKRIDELRPDDVLPSGAMVMSFPFNIHHGLMENHVSILVKFKNGVQKTMFWQKNIIISVETDHLKRI